MSQADHHTRSSSRNLSGCLVIGILFPIMVVLVLCGGLYFVFVSATSFENYREDMCIRDNLIIEDPEFRFSPGFDSAMWSRFTVEATSIDQVFDPARINTSAFSDSYELRESWIDDDWWDPENHELAGGEAQTSDDTFVRVGYIDNDDGTITVYIFWFEV